MRYRRAFPCLGALLLAISLPVGSAEVRDPRRGGGTPGRLQSGQIAQTFFSEDFTARLAGWRVIDAGVPGHSGDESTWTADNPGGRELPLTAPFAIADSDAAGFGVVDSQLLSPVVDASGASALVLRFDHHFRWYPGNWAEVGDVDVRSELTGGRWINVARFTGQDYRGSFAVDLIRFAGPDLQIRFHYHNANWEWWWAVDDVELLGRRSKLKRLSFREGFEGGDLGHFSRPAD